MENVKLVLTFIGLLVIGFIFLCGVGFILEHFFSGKGKFEKKRAGVVKKNGEDIILPAPVKKVLRFAKKVLLFSFISVGVFTVVIIILHITTGSVPDTLITEFFGYFKVEGGVLGLIKITETIVDKVTEYLHGKKGSTENENISEEVYQ